MMRYVIVGFCLLVVLNNVNAESVKTPGSIASFTQLANTQFEYNPVTDQCVMTRTQRTQFTLSVLPSIDPARAILQELAKLDAEQFAIDIKPATIAGYPAATLPAKLENSYWWAMIQIHDLNLFVQIEDLEDATVYQSEVETLVNSLRFAPASQPTLMIGSFTMKTVSDTSDSSGISTYFESKILLYEDGSFNTSRYTNVSGSNVSGFGQSTDESGQWQVRGNRILAFEPPDSFFNYRIEAFSNGLELFDESNKKLIWVRE